MTNKIDYSSLRGKIVTEFGTVLNYAAKCGLDKNRIYRICQGRCDVPTSMVLKMCEDLNIESKDIPRYFFTVKLNKS